MTETKLAQSKSLRTMSDASELARIEDELLRIQRDVDSLLTRQHELQKKKRMLEKCLKEKREKAEEQDWEKKEFEWSDKLDNVIQNKFKVPTLRPLQLSAMNCLLGDQDFLLIMPTGAGKSLCFQAPAIAADGLTLVISPLVSLMEDQVMSLTNLGLSKHCDLLCASTERETASRILSSLLDAKSTLKLLYVSPEKLAKSKTFMSKLQKSYELGRLKRIVIDEVHCCSTWGHDFRPDYKFLSILKRQFPQTVMAGLTATASTSVTSDVRVMLHMNECIVLRAAFDRPNLFYEVLEKPSNHSVCMDQLSSLIQTRFPDQSGIIYCLSQKDTETVAGDLTQRRITSRPYHGNMSAAQRTHVHRTWLQGSVKVVVATVAFGMGIDKPDVRFVIHHSLSKSVENYYQESGRAGRDGDRACCILLASPSDVIRQSVMVFTERTGLEKLYNMVEYLNNMETCRRKMIAKHFLQDGETVVCEDMCDVCSRANADSSPTDVSSDVSSLFQVLATSRSHDKKITMNKLLVDWSRKTKLNKWQTQQVVLWLLINGYVQEDFHFTPYSTISYIQPGPKKIPEKTLIKLIQPYGMEGKAHTTMPDHKTTGKSKSVKKTGNSKRKNEMETGSETESSEDFQPKIAKHSKKMKLNSKVGQKKRTSKHCTQNGIISDEDVIELD